MAADYGAREHVCTVQVHVPRNPAGRYARTLVRGDKKVGVFVGYHETDSVSSTMKYYIHVHEIFNR